MFITKWLLFINNIIHFQKTSECWGERLVQPINVRFVEDALLQEDMLEIMPAVEEANAISQELDKKMKFESMIVSPEARGEQTGRTEVMIKATNIETKHEWIWPKVKFMNRKYVMQEMYNDFLDGDDPWDLPPVSTRYTRWILYKMKISLC